MSSKKEKAYRKKYYQDNKEKLKAYQKERYDTVKETKMKDIVGATSTSQSIGRDSFFNLSCPTTNTAISPLNVIKHLQSWIFSCATLNASSVASQDLHLYATVENGANNKFLRQTKEVSKLKFEELKENKSLARLKRADNVVEVVDHPLIDLLQNMNAYNNNYESFELTSMYLDMIGDGYWWVRKDSLGVPEEIWVLQGQYMKIIPAKRNFIKGYVYGQKNASNELIKFNKDEIIHFKTPNPESMYYGMGAAQSVIGAINRMRAMDASENSRLANMGRPDFVVNYKGGKLDSSEIKKTERMWRNAFSGPNKDGRIKVMDEDFSLETLGFKPKDMEYLNGRVWSLKEIAAAFGVPYSLLDSSDTKKATSEIAERVYAKTTILPRITRIAEKLNETLVKMYDPSGRLFLAYDSPIPQDRKILLEENVGYVNAGIVTVNEARLKLGMTALGSEYDIPRVNGGKEVGYIAGQEEPEQNEEQ